jgi:hypothetical protein
MVEEVMAEDSVGFHKWMSLGVKIVYIVVGSH